MKIHSASKLALLCTASLGVSGCALQFRDLLTSLNGGGSASISLVSPQGSTITPQFTIRNLESGDEVVLVRDSDSACVGGIVSAHGQASSSTLSVTASNSGVSQSAHDFRALVTRASDSSVECTNVVGFTWDDLKATQVDVGSGHACAVLLNGDVACWGSNTQGQLGDGTTTPSSVAVTVSGVSNAIQVATGNTHSCALITGGTVKCWGDGDAAQLGDGLATDSATPVDATGLSTAVQISAGGNFTCAVLANGTVQCWGNGMQGQMGNGVNGFNMTPGPVNTITTAEEVATAGSFACARLTSGGINCWGGNYYGSLGNSGNTDSNVPVVVTGITTATDIDAEANAQHVCARLANSTVRCWGGGVNGGIGNGTLADTNVSVAVTGITTATGVSVGQNHSCASLSSGEVQCWGRSTDRQLGVETTTMATTPAAAILSSVAEISSGGFTNCAHLTTDSIACFGPAGYGVIGNGTQSYINRPREATDLQNVAELGRSRNDGLGHSCALHTNGTVSCWGTNDLGQLGDGTTTDSRYPVLVSGITTATQVVTGGYHSCALLSTGGVRCWGNGGDGILGNGGTSSSSTPVSVNTVTDAVQITAGTYHTCARRTGGGVYCWGQGNLGQMGNSSSTMTNSSPVTVTAGSLSNATSIAAGANHTCAIQSGGTIYCWGGGTNGQLGNGGSSSMNSPQGPATGVTTATQLASGGDHSCVVLAAGTIRCWGAGTSGQIGNGASSTVAIPTAVSSITNASQVSLGNGHSCALLTTGAVRCWGNGTNGQRGDGTYTATVNTPAAAITGLSGVTALSSSHSSTCARTSAGTLSCWGYADDLVIPPLFGLAVTF